MRATTPAKGTSMDGSSSSFSHPNPQTPTTKLCCDRCDGEHETAACPHFTQEREKHPDAERGGFRKLSKPGEPLSTASARVKRQPGDGNCLFHSLCVGLEPLTHTVLRKEVCDFIAASPALKIAGSSLTDWVAWDSEGKTIRQYVARMARNGIW